MWRGRGVAWRGDDTVNAPARQLYCDLGFVPDDEGAVYKLRSALAAHFADYMDLEEPPQLFMSKEVDAVATIQAWQDV